jgi:hypothetical protein
MINLVIWWTCIFFEALIVIRGFQTRAILRFPFFHLYVGGMLVCDGLLYFVYRFIPQSYPRLSWNLGLLVILLGCGILLEIFGHALVPYPGAERFARTAGLLIFVAIFATLSVCLLLNPRILQSRFMNTTLERNLVTVQAIFLACLIQVIQYYRIRLDRNILGIALGYGLCLGTTLPMLALEIYGKGWFTRVWVVLQPAAYLVFLMVWVYSLWGYQDQHERTAETAVASDYGRFAMVTRDGIAAMGSDIGKAARS